MVKILIGGVSASGWKYNTIIDDFGPLFSGGLSRTAGAWTYRSALWRRYTPP
jgi:hypothetical protein